MKNPIPISMRDVLTGLILGLIIAGTAMYTYHYNVYIRVRSTVLIKTGYDISHPENWKGTCR